MKQRIKRIGGVYYVQYREWFVWHNYQRCSGGSSAGMVYEDIVFGTEVEARLYLREEQIEIIEI